MNIDDMKDEELSMLTDEERAGMEDDDDGDDDGAAAVEDEDDDDKPDEATKLSEEAGAVEEAAAAAAAKAKAAEPGGDDGKAADEDEDDDAPSTRSTADRVDPADVQSKIDDLAKQKDALAGQLDEGEITTTEYRAALDKLNDDRNTLANQLARQQEQDEVVQKSWYNDVNRFLAKHTDVNANDTRLQSFDSVVRRVTGNSENASLSNRKQLEKAYGIWRDEMGIAEPVKPKDDPKVEKGKEPPKPKPALPPTLHNVPAAEIEIGDDGKFSYLDALITAGKTIEYENALGKLSDADQQDYLSRA